MEGLNYVFTETIKAQEKYNNSTIIVYCQYATKKKENMLNISK